MWLLIPAEISALLTSLVRTLTCGELAVVAGGTCIVGCRRGRGCCSCPTTRSSIASMSNKGADMAAMNRRLMAVNVEVAVALGRLSCCLCYWEAKILRVHPRCIRVQARLLHAGQHPRPPGSKKSDEKKCGNRQ